MRSLSLLSYLSLIISTLVAVTVHAADLAYKPGTYQIDPIHSKIGFEIPHLVISTVDGRFQTFDGTVILDPKFEKSTVKAVVQITSVDTGNPKRDDDLRGPDFFDAGKFSKMTFETKSISGTPQNFKLMGNLTIKGITNPVTFDGKYLGTVNDGAGNDKVAFTAYASIKRSSFGLKWNKMIEAGPVVGDNLAIQLRIQAAKPASLTPKPGLPVGPNGSAVPIVSPPPVKKK